jgi:hypothetical protein
VTINCIHNPTWRAHTCLQTIIICGQNFANCYDIKMLGISSFYIKFCGQTKRVLCMKACSVSTMVTSGHEIILMLAANMGIKSSLGSMFELVLAKTQSWAHICYHASSSMTLSFSWKCSTGAAWRRASCCEAGCSFTTNFQHTMGNMSGCGWLWHIQEGGLEMKGQLHGLLIYEIQLQWTSLCGDTWRNTFTKSLPGLFKIL